MSQNCLRPNCKNRTRNPSGMCWRHVNAPSGAVSADKAGVLSNIPTSSNHTNAPYEREPNDSLIPAKRYPKIPSSDYRLPRFSEFGQDGVDPADPDSDYETTRTLR